MRSASILPLFALLLTGCAMEDGQFPSLAKRPYEVDAKMTAPVEEEAPPPPSPLPQETLAAIDSALSRHASAQASFARARDTASARVGSARGSARGSESWVVAQLAISTADAARHDSLVAMADLDRLFIVRAEEQALTTGLVGLERIGEARDKVAGDVEKQNAEMARLTERLAR